MKTIMELADAYATETHSHTITLNRAALLAAVEAQAAERAGLIRRSNELIASLAAELEVSNAELLEQARLLGISGSCEAKLLAEIEAAKEHVENLKLECIRQSNEASTAHKRRYELQLKLDALESQEPIAYFNFQGKEFRWAQNVSIGEVPTIVKIEPIALYAAPVAQQPNHSGLIAKLRSFGGFKNEMELMDQAADALECK